MGVLQGIGTLRGWNSPMITDNDPRFQPKPNIPGAYYFWQLRPEQVTFWSVFSYWSLFGLHQLFVWSVLYFAQLYKKPYSNNLKHYNYFLLIGNFFFHCLHLFQTHTFYDGLAKDTPEATSQGSVIMMLVLVIGMEYKDRGLIFGWPSNNPNKVTWYMRFGDIYMKLIRKYHGYAFSWAAIYTFWYHPMESTIGHCFGFLYTSIIMLQGSLIFTNAHKNKYWTVFIEIFVIAHSGVVAYQTRGNQLWPMFVFGFGLLFFFNQIYTFDFWKNLPYALRLLPPIFYFIPTIATYTFLPDSQGRYFIRMNEIIRIPFIEIGFALMTFFIMFFISIFYDYLVKIDKGLFSSNIYYRYFKRTICLSISILIYILMVGIGVVMHVTKVDDKLDITTLMVLYVVIYIFGCCISFMFMGLSLGLDVTVKFPRIKALLTKKKIENTKSNEEEPNESKFISFDYEESQTTLKDQVLAVAKLLKEDGRISNEHQMILKDLVKETYNYLKKNENLTSEQVQEKCQILENEVNEIVSSSINEKLKDSIHHQNVDLSEHSSDKESINEKINEVETNERRNNNK
eukprot:gene11388-4555_t